MTTKSRISHLLPSIVWVWQSQHRRPPSLILSTCSESFAMASTPSSTCAQAHSGTVTQAPCLPVHSLYTEEFPPKPGLRVPFPASAQASPSGLACSHLADPLRSNATTYHVFSLLTPMSHCEAERCVEPGYEEKAHLRQMSRFQWSLSEPKALLLLCLFH